MTRFVALLRGVNVGGSRRVGMAALRSALEAAGLRDVGTYLHSGNVVFSAESGSAVEHAHSIEAAIGREFGFPVDTLVLSCDQLARIVAENPFLARRPQVDERSLHVAFLLAPLSAEQFAERTLPADAGEQAALGDGAIYLLLPNGVGRSKLASALARSAKMPTTARNWRTVSALVAMC